MTSHSIDLERKTLLVQFIAVEPIKFYATSDGTDLVQDILRSQLSRSDADIYGQEGSISIDEQGEFLVFEPANSINRTLHLPVEHLAYCGALRRMSHESFDQRNADQIHQREFENVDLANRYAHHIIGPPIFVAVFHGFDNALCYTFVTQSADDACILVMKLMRTFKFHEQQQLQRQTNQQIHPPLSPGHNSGRSLSPLAFRQSLYHDPAQIFPAPIVRQGSNTYLQNSQQDELIQKILANPNLQVVNSPAPFTSQRIDDLPILSTPSNINQHSSPFTFNNNMDSFAAIPNINRSSSNLIRPLSPPILGVPDPINNSIGNTSNPQVIYKPNNQEVVYKQNIMVRWLQPPTPPPPAPIIIREIQAPAQVQPPIICRQVPRCPPTPPPIIVREKPPALPPPGQPLIIEKRIPPAILPRQVIVERYPAPPRKPPTIIYEKYLPQAPRKRQVIVKREICQPAGIPIVQQQISGRALVPEVVHQIPQASMAGQPAFVCVPQQQGQTVVQPQIAQQMIPVYATQQHVVQPQAVRVVRQVVGPPQIALQQPQQIL